MNIFAPLLIRVGAAVVGFAVGYVGRRIWDNVSAPAERHPDIVPPPPPPLPCRNPEWERWSPSRMKEEIVSDVTASVTESVNKWGRTGVTLGVVGILLSIVFFVVGRICL